MLVIVLVVAAFAGSACQSDPAFDGSATMEPLPVPAGSEVVPHRVIAEDLAEGEERPATTIATTLESLAELETSVAMQVFDAVDFDTEVVVIFDLAESTSCPYKPLQAVLLNADMLLRPLVATSGGETCTADDNPHRIIVVVDRPAIPEELLRSE